MYCTRIITKCKYNIIFRLSISEQQICRRRKGCDRRRGRQNRDGEAYGNRTAVERRTCGHRQEI